MKIELHDEMIEDIMIATLREHIKYAKKNIKELKAIKDPKPFQLEDLGNNVKMLAAFTTVSDYFGGSL